MAGLGFGKAARTRTLIKTTAIISVTSKLRNSTPLPAENQRRQSIVAIQLRCHRVTPSGCQSRQCGLGSLRMRSAWAKLRVYEQLAALESWLQFQHRSDRQTTQRFQGALKPKTCARQTSVLPLQHWRGVSIFLYELGVALAIYLFTNSNKTAKPAGKLKSSSTACRNRSNISASKASRLRQSTVVMVLFAQQKQTPAFTRLALP